MPDKPVLWGRRPSGGDWSLPDIGLGDVDDALVVISVVIGVIALSLLLITVVFPIIVLGIEVLLVAVLLTGGIAARLLFRRPWTIRARADNGRELAWRAVGFRRSGRVRDDAAAALTLGHTQIRPSESLPATP